MGTRYELTVFKSRNVEEDSVTETHKRELCTEELIKPPSNPKVKVPKVTVAEGAEDAEGPLGEPQFKRLQAFVALYTCTAIEMSREPCSLCQEARPSLQEPFMCDAQLGLQVVQSTCFASYI